MWELPCSRSLSLALFFSAWFWATTWDQPLSQKPLCSRSAWSDCPCTWREQGWPQGVVTSPLSFLLLSILLSQKTQKAACLLRFSLRGARSRNYHTWLPLLLPQKLCGLRTFVRVVVFPVWDPCTWFGFCPCDNFNPNAFFFLFSLCKAGTVPQWLTYGFHRRVTPSCWGWAWSELSAKCRPTVRRHSLPCPLPHMVS